MSNTNPTANTTSPSSSAPKAEPQTAAIPGFPGFPAFSSFGSFDPMAMWTTSQQTWSKLMTDAAGRAQAFADQYVALETQAIARAHDAITTWAQLTHDALTYGAQLSGEARKVGFDAAKKMTAN